jgi:hypothetical protein
MEKCKNPVTLCVIHRRQNPSEYNDRLVSQFLLAYASRFWEHGQLEETWYSSGFKGEGSACYSELPQARPKEKRLAYSLACFASMQENEASKGQRELKFLLSYIVIFFKLLTSVFIRKYFQEYYYKPKKYWSCANQKQRHQLLFQNMEEFQNLYYLRSATILKRFDEKVGASRG